MPLHVREITPGFGAEVEGWSPGGELDAAAVRQLRAAFDTYGVLVFRDVHVTADDQRYISGLLVGSEPPPDRPTAEAVGHLYGTRISNKDDDGNAPHGRLLFHSDGMWSDSPQELLSLYGEAVDQPSVPTVFASTTRALARLPGPLRTRIERLTAINSTGQRARGGYDPGELLRAERATEHSGSKPIVVTHPRTGAPTLTVSQMMTSGVEGLKTGESERLLDEVFDVLYAAGNTFEHAWQERDLVVWDNLAVQHARDVVTEVGPERSLRKVCAPRATPSVGRDSAMPAFTRPGSQR